MKGTSVHIVQEARSDVGGLTGTTQQFAKLIQDLPGTHVWPLEPGTPVDW